MECPIREVFKLYEPSRIQSRATVDSGPGKCRAQDDSRTQRSRAGRLVLPRETGLRFLEVHFLDPRVPVADIVALAL